MTFCKIKFFLALFLGCSVALADVKVDNLSLSVESAYGAKKTLGFSCWGKMPFEKVVEITENLSHQRTSYELAKMTAEVLSQKTSVGCNDLTPENAQKWLNVRLQSLLNLGFYEDVISLVNNIPAAHLTTDILHIKAEAYLLSNHMQKACTIATEQVGKSDYFTKMNIMCLTLNGEKEKATFAYELFKETHPDNDAFSFAMDSFLELNPKEVKPGSFSILDVYFFKKLNLSYDEKAVPLAYVPFEKKHAGLFGNAVNIKKLFDHWENVNDEEKQYRLYLLTTYRDLFREDLKFLSSSVLWNLQTSKQNYTPLAVMLDDKPESQITGDDLLLSLWILSGNMIPADKAMLLLHKIGLNVEKYVVERLD